jgi:hypothetical protein
MVTIFRESGLKFVIYLDDHPPAHVHVFGKGSAKIALGIEEDAPRVVRTRGMKTGEVSKALRIVTEHRATLIEEWEGYHG